MAVSARIWNKIYCPFITSNQSFISSCSSSPLASSVILYSFHVSILCSWLPYLSAPPQLIHIARTVSTPLHSALRCDVITAASALSLTLCYFPCHVVPSSSPGRYPASSSSKYSDFLCFLCPISEQILLFREALAISLHSVNATNHNIR
jgi:hypothetical protein